MGTLSLSDAALLTTVTMIPLALAPLIYGYFPGPVKREGLLGAFHPH
jgi:hypothetical protein